METAFWMSSPRVAEEAVTWLEAIDCLVSLEQPDNGRHLLRVWHEADQAADVRTAVLIVDPAASEVQDT